MSPFVGPKAKLMLKHLGLIEEDMAYVVIWQSWKLQDLENCWTMPRALHPLYMGAPPAARAMRGEVLFRFAKEEQARLNDAWGRLQRPIPWQHTHYVRSKTEGEGNNKIFFDVICRESDKEVAWSWKQWDREVEDVRAQDQRDPEATVPELTARTEAQPTNGTE